MTSAQRAALEAALQIPYPAFPNNDLKLPTCPTGFYDAATGGALEELWWLHPGVLPGVPIGQASGFSALDVDPDKGGFDWWSANRDRLPPTRLHETRSGGIHALFKHRPGLRNSESKIARGIDVRGEGGYIIWWPATGLSVVDNPPAEWPAWLKPPEPKRSSYTPLPPGSTASSRYGASALERACENINGAPCGSQEGTLNREAFGIGSLAGGGSIDPSTALNRLTQAGLGMASYDARRPWSAREVISKVQRAFEQGTQRPRQPETRR